MERESLYVMTLEKLLDDWNLAATEDYVLCRGIAPWKWQCYALAAGMVDGRKWKISEIARDRGVSRARICIVIKEVKRRLAEVQEPDPRREFFCRLRNFDLRNASVRAAFGLDGGRKKEFNGKCYPDVVNSVFIAEDREWACDEVRGWKSEAHNGPVFKLHCYRIDADNPPRGKQHAPPAINVHPIVMDCGGRLFVLDRFESSVRIDRILLKPLA